MLSLRKRSLAAVLVYVGNFGKLETYEVTR